jgi:23S rRNA (guanosine2251-2'-O)-methyltransferase
VAGSADADDVDLIFGMHAVRHALEHAPDTLSELWIVEARGEAARMRQLAELAAERGLQVRYVDRARLDRATGHGRHQGIAARRRPGTEYHGDLESLLARSRGPALLLLVLDGVQDPHNLGACVRAADAAGADAVIIPKDRAAPMTAVAHKVASGAAEHIPVFTVTNLARELRRMKEAGIWITGLADDGEQSLYDIDLRAPTALVMGGEEHGLHHNVREHCDHVARLPMRGIVESLNVSVAAGICLYEALRQRGIRS